MFASRSIAAFRGGRNSLDLPVAALAGLAVAFVAFAAPADLLAGLVGASGLPALIPAAEPPLGLKARVGLGAGGGLIVFAVAFVVLRWLDRFGARRAEQAEEAAELEMPRLRRRDIHPDAPARMPLLAVHELGEPELELNEVEPEPIAVEVDPSPLLARKPDRDAEPEPFPRAGFEPEPTPFEASRPAALPDTGLSDQAGAYALSQRNWADFEPEPQPDPEPVAEPDHPWIAEPAIEAEPEWQPPSPQAWGFDEAEPGEPQEVESWARDPLSATTPEPEPEPEPEAQAYPEPPSETVAEPEWQQPAAPVEAWNAMPPLSIAPEPAEPEIAHYAEPEPEPEVAEYSPPPATGSIAELMERLEKGLARHRTAPAEPAVPPPAAPVGHVAPAPSLSPDPAEDRLANAIESLQRFASRQD